MATKFDRLKKNMLADPAARTEYEKLGPKFEIANTLVTARRRAKSPRNSSPYA